MKTKTLIGAILLILGSGAIVVLAFPLSLTGKDLLRFWIPGAAALGLLTGYTTGLSI